MKFEGILPALITPLTAEEKLNVPVLHKLVNYLLDEGADGLYIGGATGEGPALRQDVREELAAESIAAMKGRKPAIVHIASMDFHEAVELAKQAERCGADAISAIPPLFFAYDEDDVYNYYKALAESVHIPLMIYYNMAAGFRISAKFAARMFEVDNITAIKWTSSAYDEMVLLKDLTHGEMNIINGPDEMLLMGLNAGADGGIGTTYNFQCSRIKGIYNNFKAGNIAEAQKLQTEANRIIDALKNYKVLPGSKVIMERMGFAVGNASFPMKSYTEAQKDQMMADFIAAGLKI